MVKSQFLLGIISCCLALLVDGFSQESVSYTSKQSLPDINVVPGGSNIINGISTSIPITSPITSCGANSITYDGRCTACPPSTIAQNNMCMRQTVRGQTILPQQPCRLQQPCGQIITNPGLNCGNQVTCGQTFQNVQTPCALRSLCGQLISNPQPIINPIPQPYLQQPCAFQGTCGQITTNSQIIAQPILQPSQAFSYTQPIIQAYPQPMRNPFLQQLNTYTQTIPQPSPQQQVISYTQPILQPNQQPILNTYTQTVSQPSREQQAISYTQPIFQPNQQPILNTYTQTMAQPSPQAMPNPQINNQDQPLPQPLTQPLQQPT